MHFNSFARLHAPSLFAHLAPLSPPLHDAQPPGVSSATGSPCGDPPEQVDTPDGGAAGSNSNMNSFYVSLGARLVENSSSAILSSVVSSVHAQPPGHDTGLGSPPGDPPTQSVSPDGGALVTNSNTNSVFLSLAPRIPCRLCRVTFQPVIGVECDSICGQCGAAPPLKRRRIVGKTNPHRKAGPPP